MRINGHGHVLPEPSQIPAFLKDKRLFWIDDDKKFMRQGDWSRPINGSGFFLKEKIEWMKQNNIDHAVMLCLSQLYCNGWEEKDCADAILFQNDFLQFSLCFFCFLMCLYDLCGSAATQGDGQSIRPCNTKRNY